MTASTESGKNLQPLRILITALGGEGGGTLMNWLVSAARGNGYRVQATSVPGVAQRTGATSYYLEIGSEDTPAVLNLLPMPGRVDIVLSSELVEAARVIESGYVSPELTTLVGSLSRSFAIAEKIQQTDGRFDVATIEQTAREMARLCVLVDLQELARNHNTYISATLFGAVAGCGALPWSVAKSRQVLGQGSRVTASIAGFDAAVKAVEEVIATMADNNGQVAAVSSKGEVEAALPENDVTTLAGLMEHATARLEDYQDKEYAELYRTRMDQLVTTGDSNSTDHQEALLEVARRLANWMAFEDIARVADLKTRPDRFAEVRSECQAKPDQIVRITEYLKPRAEEIADMLPARFGEKIMQRVEQGKTIPFLDKGRRIPSNAAWGYWLLRLTASMKRYRRKSLRYRDEQQEIQAWLETLLTTLPRSTAFARVLAELPRVRKGYSDTLQRGLTSYRTIFESIVKPAVEQQNEAEAVTALREALDASFKDESHQQLKESVVKFQPKASLYTTGQANAG